MFQEPELLTAAPEFRQQLTAVDAPVDGGQGTGAPIDALRSQAIRARFWKAKTRRELGWWEPTTEQVSRVRDRYRQ